MIASVRTGKVLGVVPFAHALHGSVVVNLFLGFTRRHAAVRARRWLAATGEADNRD